MPDQRRRNVNWTVADSDGKIPTWERVQVAVLMDIRDELQALRRLMECPNVRKGFVAMQGVEKHLRLHGAKPKPKRKVK